MVRDSPSTEKTFAIEILNDSYMPSKITVNPGDTITWTNRGDNLKNVADGLIVTPDNIDAQWLPIQGLESQLEVEVTHMGIGISKVLHLRPVSEDPGHYTTDVIPSSPGQYSFRFFGTVAGEPFNEIFKSGEGRFDHVQAADVIQFPEALPSIRELESAVRGAKVRAEEALDSNKASRDALSSTSRFGFIGSILGIVGILLGITGIFLASRRT